MEAKEYTGWRHGTSKQHAPQDRIQKTTQNAEKNPKIILHPLLTCRNLTDFMIRPKTTVRNICLPKLLTTPKRHQDVFNGVVTCRDTKARKDVRRSLVMDHSLSLS